MEAPNSTPCPLPPRQPVHRERRRTPRQTVRGVRCVVSLGPGLGWMLLPGRVVDFSLTGMRIRLPLTWKAGMQRRVRLYAAGVRLDFVGKAIWSRRDGRLNHIVGVAFQRLTPQDDAVLADLLARHGVEAPTTVSAAA